MLRVEVCILGVPARLRDGTVWLTTWPVRPPRRNPSLRPDWSDNSAQLSDMSSA